MNFGLPLAVLAAGLFGTADFLGGLAARRVPALVVTVVVGVIGAAPVLLLALLAGGAPAPADLLWGAAGGICGSLGVTLLYHVLARGPVGVVAPISAVCGVMVPVAVGLLLGERPTPAAAVGIALAGIAVVLVSGGGAPAGVAPGARAERKVLMLAVLSGLGLGGFLVCLARVGETAGLAPLLAARAAGTATVVLVMLARRVPFTVPAAARKVAFWAALVDGFANVLYLVVARAHAVSIVATIVSLAPSLTVLLGWLVLKESFHRRQMLGLALAGVAVVLLTTGG